MLPFVDNLMPFRYQHLEMTLKGLEKSSVPLIEYNGTTFLPAGVSDDTGIYYFVPKIANIFGLNLDAAILVFFFSLLFVGLTSAIISIFGLQKRILHRIISLGFLAVLSGYLILRGDIYILSATTALTIIPLCYYLKNKKIQLLYRILFFVLFGIIISLSNFIRSNSGTAVLIFLITYLIVVYFHDKKKILFFGSALVIGLMVFNLFAANLKNNRDEFLSQFSDSHSELIEGHVLWHSIYLGFGFLNNNYGIIYNDDFAYAKARALKPEIIIHSDDYEKLMFSEVIKLLKNDPWFVIKTVAAKFGVVLVYLLLFTNIGFYYIFRSRRNLRILLPFVPAVLFNLLFPVVVMPFPGYMIGIVAIAMIFSIMSIEEADEGIKESNDFSIFFKKKLQVKN